MRKISSIFIKMSFLFFFLPKETAIKNYQFVQEKKCSPKISHFFAFRSFAKSAKIFTLICFAKKPKISRKKNKCENFARKYGREIINYDIIKLLMLSSQSREFHKFFCATNCCSNGLRGIFLSLNYFLKTIFAKFRIFC